MADTQGVTVHTGIDPKKNFHLDVPAGKTVFHCKGSDNYDWGMKDRLSRIFNPKSGNTLMLAFDHGYIMGASTGLERLDILIPELAPDVDVLMATRGALRSCVPPMYNKAVALRCSAGSTVLSDDVTNETIGTDIEDAIRMNASCMAVQTFMGTEDEKSSLTNLCNTINAGMKYGIPTLGVVAVGKNMARNPQFFSMATRVIAELGAQLVKVYYCEDFEKVTAGCPVPIVIAGGKIGVLELDGLVDQVGTFHNAARLGHQAGFRHQLANGIGSRLGNLGGIGPDQGGAEKLGLGTIVIELAENRLHFDDVHLVLFQGGFYLLLQFFHRGIRHIAGNLTHRIAAAGKQGHSHHQRQQKNTYFTDHKILLNSKIYGIISYFLPIVNLPRIGDST